MTAPCVCLQYVTGVAGACLLGLLLLYARLYSSPLLLTRRCLLGRLARSLAGCSMAGRLAVLVLCALCLFPQPLSDSAAATCTTTLMMMMMIAGRHPMVSRNAIIVYVTRAFLKKQAGSTQAVPRNKRH